MEGNIRVRFITEFSEFAIPQAPFAVPLKLGRSGLSEIINHVLERPVAQPFDFMINGRLIRTPLYKILEALKVSKEIIVEIQYMPAVSVSDNHLSHDAPSWIGSISCARDGVVLTGCYDGKAQIFSSSSMALTQSITVHNEPIRAVLSIDAPNKASSSPYQFITASKDRLIKVWETSLEDNRNSAQARLLGVCKGHINSVESLAYSSNYPFLISGDWAGNVIGWDLTSIVSMGNNSSSDNKIAATRKKRKASAIEEVSTDRSVDISQSVGAASVLTLRAHTQTISGLDLVSHTGGTEPEYRLLSCSWDHSLKEWDIASQDCVATFTAPKAFTSVHFSSRANLAASSHPDGKIRMWDIRQRDEAHCIDVFGASSNTQWVSQVRWHPGSSFLFASSDYDGVIRVWDTRASIPLGKSSLHDGKALCVDWVDITTPTITAQPQQQQERSGVVAMTVSGGSDCFLKTSTVADVL